MNCCCYRCAGPKTFGEYVMASDPLMFSRSEYLCPRCLAPDCRGASDHHNDCAPQEGLLMACLNAMTATQLFALMMAVVGFIGLGLTGAWPFGMMLPVATILWLGSAWEKEYRKP